MSLRDHERRKLSQDVQNALDALEVRITEYRLQINPLTFESPNCPAPVSIETDKQLFFPKGNVLRTSYEAAEAFWAVLREHGVELREREGRDDEPDFF